MPDQPNLFVSTHPAVLHKLALLRDERTDPKKFRELVRELGADAAELLGFAIDDERPFAHVDHWAGFVFTGH